LDAVQERMWAGFVELESRRSERRQFLDSVRAELCDHAGLKWEKLTKIAGCHRTHQASFNLERIESRGLTEFFSEAAREDHPLHDQWKRKMYPFFGGPKRGNEVWRVEKRYRAAIIGACGHEMSYNHINETGQFAYSFALMAEDQEFAASSGRAVAPAIAAAWEFVQSAGECWVFDGAVVLLDRPAKVRLNSESFLHCEDGPAVVFREGTKIWARNGRSTRGRASQVSRGALDGMRFVLGVQGQPEVSPSQSLPGGHTAPSLSLNSTLPPLTSQNPIAASSAGIAPPSA
jgi:hypothetical protein